MTFPRPSLHGIGLALALACAMGAASYAATAQHARQAAAPASAVAQPSAQSDTSKPQSAYSLPPGKLAKAIALSRIRNILDIVVSLWALAILWLLLATRAAAGLQAWAERVFRRRWLQGILFFASFIVVFFLANLPLAWFSQHVSRSYGISVQSWGSWLADQGKALGLSVAIGIPVLLLFNRIVRRWPRRFWLGAWVVTLPLLVLSIFVEPLVEPLFNKYEPLAKSDPALVAKLEEVVARTGTRIPPDRMYLMKASEKTTGLDAYVSGIGATKRIVVWDTTAGRIPDDEILFVFAHESGHYVLHHLPKMLAGYAAGLFFVYWGCAVFAGSLARRFRGRWGLDDRQPGAPTVASLTKGGTPSLAPSAEDTDHSTQSPLLAGRAGFIVLIFAITLAGFVLEPAANAFSRHFEHQADVYGQEAIHGLVPEPQKTAVAAFNALGEAWLEDPNPSPFIEFWEYDHPSVKIRANFAAHYNPWANGGHGEFFKQ